MYLELTMEINKFIDSLGQPTSFFCYLALWLGIPILCLLITMLDHKLEEKQKN